MIEPVVADAVAVKLTFAGAVKVAPSAGAVRLTVGGLLVAPKGINLVAGIGLS